MSKALKKMMADDLRKDLEGVDDLLVVRFKTMNAEQNFALRLAVREHGARLRVIHNRTARHALKDECKDLADTFKGQTAIAIGGEPIPVAKALVDASEKETLEVRGGFIEGEMLDGEGVKILAASPDKPTLRGMLAGVIQAPARGIAASLQAVYGGLARCLQARVDEGGAPADEGGAPAPEAAAAPDESAQAGGDERGEAAAPEAPEAPETPETPEASEAPKPTE